MDLKIIYEDRDILVIDKPAGIVVFEETRDKKQETRTLIDLLLEKNPELKNVGGAPRYGIVHRLDKNTSGILLVAKNTESLIFFQKQFKNRRVEKKYLALATGIMKEDEGEIKTFIGRSPQDPRKQKAYPIEETSDKKQEIRGWREAITGYKVLERFEKYTLLEVQIKTGRKHQIRCHMAYLYHPIAGDNVYGFKDSPLPEGLHRQFLHASYVKISLPTEEIKEFNSALPEELQNIIKNLKLCQ